MDVRTTFYLWTVLWLFSGESRGNTQCSKTGENVYLFLQKKDLNLWNVEWKKEKLLEKIAAIKNNTRQSFTPAAEIVANGTLKITNVQTNWSGEYIVELFSNDGKHTLNETHHLVVSDLPVVQFACISGTAVFYCACDNDHNVTYNWNISDSNIREETVFNNSRKHIILENMSGNVSCFVEKKGCSFHSEPLNFSCTKSQPWCVSVLISISALLLCGICVMAGFLICFHIRYKQHHLDVKSEGLSGRRVSREAAGGDIIYSDVRISKQR